MSGVWLAINTFGTMGLLAVFDAMGMRIDCVETSTSVRRQTFLIYPHSLDLTPALLNGLNGTCPRVRLRYPQSCTDSANMLSMPHI